MPWFWPVVATLRARGKLAWLRGWLTGVSTSEPPTFSWEPLPGPGSRSILPAELRTKRYFNTAFNPSRRLPSGLQSVDWVGLRDGVARAKQAGGSPTEILQRIGSLAVAAASGRNGSSRREIVAAQLPVKTWPEKRLLIAAVNAETGERRAFDRDSGIDLVDAVIASTASFGWPPTLFEGEHYIDGGFYSTNNADLATGFDRVMILAMKPPPGVPIPSMSLVTLEETVKILQDSGALVEVSIPMKTLWRLSPRRVG